NTARPIRPSPLMAILVMTLPPMARTASLWRRRTRPGTDDRTLPWRGSDRVASGREPAVEIVRSTDERMSERLREVAEVLAPAAYLFAVEPEVVRVAEHLSRRRSAPAGDRRAATGTRHTRTSTW